MAVSPFAELNLRENPFGAPFFHERGELAVPTVNIVELAARLRQPGFAVELAGAPGRGKTTHLFALHRHFSDLPITRIEQAAPIPPIPEAPVVFIDEAGRLPRRTRRELFRRTTSFVLTTHTSFARELRRAGLTVRAIRLSGLSQRELRRYITARLDWARIGPGPVPTVPEEWLSALRTAHGGDVRAIEDTLYEWLQQLKDACRARSRPR